MRVVFLGPPGAGKGTQAQFFSQKYNVPQLSTGEILREVIRRETEVGKKAKAMIESGLLVSDDIVNQIVLDRLGEDDCMRGFILDGYPRTVDQARVLQKILQSKNMQLDVVIEFVVDKDVLIERIKNRVQKAASLGERIRSDDDPDVFSKRLIEYNKKTVPLSKFYLEQGLLRTVDGMADVAEVSNTIEKIFK
ncbi:adenylate kinase [Bartonella sp. F02]|uniref:adenylate kinase n=1 Tax=Bartonella sp. F02 TaxID=2967262 RepID=UPI0022A987C7|nr:adenylate kinase [Bartonella sp. F02]MCZ2328140.1 adenylate kinase [Bartonella sp. F02]